MSAAGAKKLTLALHLDPAACEADGEAIRALQEWYESSRQGCATRPELDERIRGFHHDVYLAGLRLYLFDPTLCQAVALALAHRGMTLDSLIGQLRGQGLWPAPEDSGFSAAQLEQLTTLLKPTSASKDPASDAEGTGAASLSLQLSEQREQLCALQAELTQLRRLAEEQSQQLRQLKPGSGRKAAGKAAKRGAKSEDLELAGMATQIAKMQKVRAKGVF